MSNNKHITTLYLLSFLYKCFLTFYWNWTAVLETTNEVITHTHTLLLFISHLNAAHGFCIVWICVITSYYRHSVMYCTISDALCFNSSFWNFIKWIARVWRMTYMVTPNVVKFLTLIYSSLIFHNVLGLEFISLVLTVCFPERYDRPLRGNMR